MFFTCGGASLSDARCWRTRRGQDTLSRKCNATALGKESTDTTIKEHHDLHPQIYQETRPELTLAQSRCCADCLDRRVIVVECAVRGGRPDGILARIV